MAEDKKSERHGTHRNQPVGLRAISGSDRTVLHRLDPQDAVDFIVESPWGFAEVSPEMKFRWVNPAYCKILGAAYTQVLGTTFMDWTHPDDVGGDLELAEKVRSGELANYSLRKRYLQYGSTPKRQIVIWGFLSVAGKWQEGKFTGYRVQFRPFNAIDESQKLVIDWREGILWAGKNWKTIGVVILTLTSLIFGGSERLSSILSKIQEAEKSAESLTGQPGSGH